MIGEKKAPKEVIIKSPLPPVLTGILSLIIPGLGQAISRQVQRGFLILASFVSMLGILIWRIQVIGALVDGFKQQAVKTLDRAPAFLIIVLLSLIGLWLWAGWDAMQLAKTGRKRSNVIFLVVLVGFFVQGWEISEINLYRMVTQAHEGWSLLSRVLWPWEAAITHDEEIFKAGQDIRIGTEGDLPVNEVPANGKGPDITVTPLYGDLSSQDEQYNAVAGTILTVKGTGFEPNTRTELYWIDPNGNEFRPRQDGKYTVATTDANGDFTYDLIMPYSVTPPNARGAIYHRLEARQTFQIGGPKASDPLKTSLGLMAETIFMGMMATFFGIILSIPISFLAARNIMGGSKIGLAIYWFTRAILNIIRSIEPMIWAVIAVVWVGLGPFAGIIALTIHSIAALGKLYSEAIEGIDNGPIEALTAVGATKMQTIVYAILPQMISPFVSFSIYRWDINVRMSTIIGMVGGGGIGFVLIQWIRLLDYQAAGIAVWFIALTVALLDYVSAEIRNRFI